MVMARQPSRRNQHPESFGVAATPALYLCCCAKFYTSLLARRSVKFVLVPPMRNKVEVQILDDPACGAFGTVGLTHRQHEERILRDSGCIDRLQCGLSLEPANIVIISTAPFPIETVNSRGGVRDQGRTVPSHESIAPQPTWVTSTEACLFGPQASRQRAHLYYLLACADGRRGSCWTEFRVTNDAMAVPRHAEIGDSYKAAREPSISDERGPENGRTPQSGEQTMSRTRIKEQRMRFEQKTAKRGSTV